MKSSFCIDLQRFMLIPTKFPLSHKKPYKDTFFAFYSKKTWDIFGGNEYLLYLCNRK